MRVHYIIAALLLTLCDGAGGAGPSPSEADVVAYARKADVAKLDPALKSESLEAWLSSPQLRLTTLKWRLGDCDLQPTEWPPKHDSPLCARIDFRRPKSYGWMSLKIGTVWTGIGGRPELFGCTVNSYSPPAKGRFRSVSKLSELPGPLDAADAEAQAR